MTENMTENTSQDQNDLTVSIHDLDWDGNGTVTLTRTADGREERVTLDLRDAAEVLERAASEIREKRAQYGQSR